MPAMNGVQLARWAKAMQPGIEVLLATGYAPRAVEREARQEGRVLFKPFRQGELLREIEALLAAR